MNAGELRSMSIGELEAKLAELTEGHFNLRFQHGVAQLENTAGLPKIRRDIARVRTIIKELQSTDKTGKE
jgi:large subunit ribosomal protein L29